MSDQDISEERIKKLIATLAALLEATDIWRPNIQIIKDADSGDIRFIVKAQGKAQPISPASSCSDLARAYAKPRCAT